MAFLRDVRSRCAPQESEIHSLDGDVEHIAHNVNADYVRQYKLDGDVFPKGVSPMRCDYLVINDGKNTAYFIELSSYKKVKHAFDQLNQSHAMLQPELNGASCHFHLVLGTATTKSTLRGKLIRDWRSQGKNRRVGVTPMSENI